MSMSKVEEADGVIVEYILAPKMVVFSHGFGVRRHTSGFFTEIAQNLPLGFGYVLFDYYEYDEATHTVTLTDFTQQTQKLRKVLDWTAHQQGVTEVNIIAHSIGSIVTALVEPMDAAKVIMLAPPANIGENTRNYFTAREGARQEAGVWIVPRRDGTTSRIPASLFDEFESTDAVGAITRYAERKELFIILAGADEILTDEDYGPLEASRNIHFMNVDNANHNFEGESRQKVIQLIREYL